MSIIMNLITPKWTKWRVYHSKAEAEEIQSVFEREHVRYRLSAYTRESRTLSTAHLMCNGRDNTPIRNTYLSDAGFETYTFELHRDDIKRAAELISGAGSAREGTGYDKPYNRVGI